MLSGSYTPAQRGWFPVLLSYLGKRIQDELSLESDGGVLLPTGGLLKLGTVEAALKRSLLRAGLFGHELHLSLGRPGARMGDTLCRRCRFPVSASGCLPTRNRGSGGGMDRLG